MPAASVATGSVSASVRAWGRPLAGQRPRPWRRTLEPVWAGIARSGSYYKTNQPFGFQSERRSLFEARDVYIQLSPTFFADRVDEPILIIHGADDSNPGPLTFQSEVFFEAVRGSGGTARLVLLPFEDHGYRARESVERVIWEQLRWFDEHVKGSGSAAPQGSGLE